MASKRIVSIRRPQLCRSATAEIGLDDDGICNDLRRRTLSDNAAFGQHEHVFGEAHHRLHHMLDHQDGDATPA